MKDLHIDHRNPVMKAKYFGVIFDEVPTYSEIKDETQNIEKIPGVNEIFKLINPEIVSLVRQCDSRWNTIYHSLELLRTKLTQLGFTYQDGEVVVIEPKNYSNAQLFKVSSDL